jgi:class 3 adenylate cyclase
MCAAGMVGHPCLCRLRVGSHGRMLATLLFTDLVDSTVIASQVGDVAWRELLSRHFEAVREQVERFGGREVKTTGDGLLATFAGPAQALYCAVAICHAANREGLHLRAGVHVGEVELVGSDVRGVAVHEAARIMAKAREDEILVSEITRTLAVSSDLAFQDRGRHTLKGAPRPMATFRLPGGCSISAGVMRQIPEGQGGRAPCG